MPTADGASPLVTICVPTIGRTDYLETSLQSLRRQTYAHCEILILDNASGADAQPVLADFVASTPAARLLRVAERLPMFANFNRGIREARGDYVVFFHDDDIYHSTFVETHVRALEANPGAAFAAGNFDVIDGAGRTVTRHRGIRRTEVWRGRFFIERLFRRGRNDLPTPGIVFRRAALDRYDFDERLPINWGDFVVLMRMAERWDVVVLAATLYAWRVHGQNGSNIAFSQSVPLLSDVLLDYSREFLERHPGEHRFVDHLRRHARRVRTRGLVWGWFAAADAAEGRACRQRLEVSAPAAARVLRLMETAGLTVERRRAALPAARYVATLLGA